MPLISMYKRYTTRSGRAVRIRRIDADDDEYPVVALVAYRDRAITATYTAQGEYYSPDMPDPMDLIEIEDPE